MTDKISIRIFKKIIFLLLIILGSSCFVVIHAQTIDLKPIWQIGEQDDSAAEFALTPNAYKDFVSNGFGGKDRYYVVGNSNPSIDWPYILPGPKDGFAGYGYWAGLALHHLPIYFELDNVTTEGTCSLVVIILEVSSENAPLFRAIINGKAYNHQLQAGKSGNLPQDLSSNPQTISFSFPATELKKGINEIIFQNMKGKWCAFDAIKMDGPKELHLVNPGNTILKSVGFSDFEMGKVTKCTQPLLVDIRQQKNNASIKVIVDNKEMTKNMEPGHSILEFYLPAVKNKRNPKLASILMVNLN